MKNPRVGFVIVGCPKALVDSERILTQLRVRGYDIAPEYSSADLVVVNTCGFIDAAIDESLQAIGEALRCQRPRHRHRLPRCQPRGASSNGHPRVLAVTGPHATEQVLREVEQHLPRPHEPYLDLVPAQGIRLTPRQLLRI
jgi:ribosomal protein S12 methylthiotransferase